MRIAQIAPLTESVPPKLYGGTERVVSYITEALVDLGHDVTLFASGDSVTSAKLEPVWPRALRLDPGIRDRIAPHMLLMELVRRQADDFDVLHFHMDYYSFSVFKRQDTLLVEGRGPAIRDGDRGLPGGDVPDPHLGLRGIARLGLRASRLADGRNSGAAGVKRRVEVGDALLFDVEHLLAVQVPDGQGTPDDLRRPEALHGGAREAVSARAPGGQAGHASVFPGRLARFEHPEQPARRVPDPDDRSGARLPHDAGDPSRIGTYGQAHGPTPASRARTPWSSAASQTFTVPTRSAASSSRPSRPKATTLIASIWP